MKYKHGPAVESTMFLPTPMQVVAGPEKKKIACSSEVYIDRAAPTSTGPDPP